MKKIGLTGVMGAGKSSVIDIIKESGITVLDCDKINAKLLQQKEAGYEQLIACFGDILLDEQRNIDKKKMSDYIFTNPERKQKAEGILHPLIKADIERQMEMLSDKDIVVVEVPLLYEVGWESFFDEVWVVACKEELLLQRLVQFRHFSITEAKRRLASQISQTEKIAKADRVFYNNGDKESLKKQICDILKVY